MAIRPKQKTVRVADPDLFNECRELLKTEFGNSLTEAQVITGALNWLKLGRTQRMIPFDEAAEQAKRGYLPHTCQTIAEVLEVLMAAGLLEPAEYICEGNPETLQVRLLKDGEVVRPVKPIPETESPAPDWMNEYLPAKKLAVN